MKSVKKQHWLPCTYLSQFAIPGYGVNRNAKIHCVSAKGIQKREVEEEGYSNWFYRGRNENSNESEALFNIAEDFYGMLINKLLFNKGLSEEENVFLLHFLILLHIRNPAYINQTELSNFDKVQNMFSVVLEIMTEKYEILPLPFSIEPDLTAYLKEANRRFLKAGVEISKEDLWTSEIRKQIFNDTWQLCFVKALDDPLFTTDHPVIMMGSEPHVHVIISPITPRLLGVAFDKNIYRIHRYFLTTNDYRCLTKLLLGQTQRCIYSSESEESKLSHYSEYLSNRPHLPFQNHVNEDGWIPAILQIDKCRDLGLSFDFLSKTNEVE